MSENTKQNYITKTKQHNHEPLLGKTKCDVTTLKYKI